MNEHEFKARTKQFALDIVDFVSQLPKDRQADVLARQLLRSGTSVGANYRSATRAQSVAHMVSKLAIVEEEADESGYWLELILEAGIVPPGHQAVRGLQREASEIVGVTVASKKTVRARDRTIAGPRSKIENRESEASR